MAGGSRVDEVVEAGLGLYAQGDLIGALARWRHALELDPASQRARQYVSYVEDHFEILDERFRAAREGSRPPAGGPVGGTTIEIEADDPMEDEDDAYESMELSVAEGEEAAASAEPPGEPGAPGPAGADGVSAEPGADAGWRSKSRQHGLVLSSDSPDSIDEGWSLEGVEELWPSSRDEAETLEISSSSRYLDDLSDLGAAPGGGQEAGTGEITLPEGMRRRSRRGVSSAPPPVSHGAAGFDLSDFESAFVPHSERQAAATDGAAAQDAEVRVTFRAPVGGALAGEAAGEDDDGDGADAPTAEHRAVRAGPDGHPGVLDLTLDGDDELTMDRNGPPPLEDTAGGGDSVTIDQHLLSFEDETYERPSLAAIARGAADPATLAEVDSLTREDLGSGLLDLGTRPGGRAGSEGDAERETTQLYTRAVRPSQPTVSSELIAAELEAELDDAVALDPSLGDEVVKARISWLIERARLESQAGRYAVAVVAIDLALEEHADSAVAQKLIHSNRELLYEVYAHFLGDLGAVPAPAMPMQLVSTLELDHRAAFLLSRVDGVLTLEDVLDVSGMARLEAFRYLSRLLLRGVLELRS